LISCTEGLNYKKTILERPTNPAFSTDTQITKCLEPSFHEVGRTLK